MKKVLIGGFSAEEGTREFEIFDKEVIEQKIDGLCQGDVFRKILDMAGAYSHTGTVYASISVCDGEVRTYWVQQGHFGHPWDEFCEVVLHAVDSPLLDPENSDLLDIDDPEWEKFEESGMSAEEFIIAEYGEKELEARMENYFDWLVDEFGAFDDARIKEQLDRIYRNAF